MNDDPTLDELVSAYLDGEATVDEVARVEQSAELTARAATLRSVRDAVAAPVVAPPEGHREQAVSAALRASSTAANVTSLSIHRARSARVMRLASIAAVIAVFMLAGSLILLTRDSGDQSETVASEAPTDTAAADIAAADDAEASTDEATRDVAEPAAEELASEEPAEPEMATDEAMGDVAEQAAEAPAAEGESAPFAEFGVAPRLAIDPQTDFDDLAAALLDQIDSTNGDTDFDAEDPLPACTIAFLGDLDGEVLGVTRTTVAGIEVGAVAFSPADDPAARTVAVFELDAPACGLLSFVES